MPVVAFQELFRVNRLLSEHSEELHITASKNGLDILGFRQILVSPLVVLKLPALV